jgi:hypothetical protein
MSEQNPYLTSPDTLAKAGRFPEGAYNWRIETMTPQEKEVQNDNPDTGSRAGDKYHVITGRLVAFQQAIYNEDGEFETIEDLDPEQSRFQDFPVSGGGLKMITSFYRAVTGRELAGHLNQDSGRYQPSVDLRDTAEELIGSSAWNRIYHAKPNKRTGAIYDKMTYTFTKNPPRKMYIKKETEGDEG